MAIDQTKKVGDGSLSLHGKCTNHIWLMEDGEEPHTIGIRMDCGDSGTVYVTHEQAQDLVEQLQIFLGAEADRPTYGKRAADPLRSALERIVNEVPGCDCLCDDENCCEKVGEYCAQCIARSALKAVETR